MLINRFNNRVLNNRTESSIYCFADNMELNDLRIIICLRKSEVFVERISVCDVMEDLAEHGIDCLPCFCINDVINMLASQL